MIIKIKVIDNALVIFFPGPFTATGEDIIELHIHGSVSNRKESFSNVGETEKFPYWLNLVSIQKELF